MILQDADVFVRPLNMETGIHEQIHDNGDGTYIVFLNARDSFDVQKKSYDHALRHIRNGDFEKSSVQEIELAAHGQLSRQYLEEWKNQFSEYIKAMRKRRKRDKRKLAQYQKRRELLENSGHYDPIGEWEDRMADMGGFRF